MMKAQLRIGFRKNEQGLASFIVVFVMMLIISLVTLSFAQIIRREQRQALDRHLSTRAFYAAESGINTAVNALNNGYPGDKADCGPDASGLLDTSAYTLDAASNTELNCLTIDGSPTNLQYPNLVKGQSLVVPLHTSAAMTTLNFSWQSKTATNATSYATCAAANGLTPQAGWGCTAPLIRVDFLNTSGALTRASTNTVYTVYMYPTSGAGSGTTNYAAGTRGVMANARCAAANTPNDCNMTVNMTGPSRDYYLRIMPYYMDTSLTITPMSGGSPVETSGAQAIIDSTGKALDVTRRLQVRKSLTTQGMIPEFGIESAAGLCKLYLVMAGAAASPSSIDLNLAGGGTLHDGSPCALD
jgi:Tfp pilus assembly protein PilX